MYSAPAGAGTRAFSGQNAGRARAAKKRGAPYERRAVSEFGRRGALRIRARVLHASSFRTVCEVLSLINAQPLRPAVGRCRACVQRCVVRAMPHGVPTLLGQEDAAWTLLSHLPHPPHHDCDTVRRQERCVES